METLFCNGNDKKYQKQLNALLEDVFFDFEFWYELELWDENYESYSILEDNMIISNICVYKTQLIVNGQCRQALSLGAVATKKEYRGRGFSRTLMEQILNKYDSLPMYLSANENVVGFYPRFGFERIYEKQPVLYRVVKNDIQPTRISYNDPKVWRYVKDRVNYAQKLDCLNTASISMFHIHQGYLKNCLFEVPELNTLIIAKQQETTLKLIGVFSLQHITFLELVHYLPFSNVEKIEFGFMPYWPDISYAMEEHKTDPFFVRGLTCELGDFKFPELATT